LQIDPLNFCCTAPRDLGAISPKVVINFSEKLFKNQQFSKMALQPMTPGPGD